MKSDARIYVAGHRGMVGSAILRNLRARGFTNTLTRTRGELDLTRQADVERFFDRTAPEYVFLAAARVGGIWANATMPGRFIHENLAIQTHVLESARRAGVKRLIFLGSSCIYPRDCPQPIREESLMTGPLEETNAAYATAKIAGICMCDAYNREHGTAYLPVMPTNLYGPGDNFDLETSHVLPALIRKFHLAKLAGEGRWEEIRADERRHGSIPGDLRANLTAISETAGHPAPSPRPDGGSAEPAVILWGTGSPRREFLHVDDLADACVHLMVRTDTTKLTNIGTGRDISIRELAERIMGIVGYRGEVVHDRSKPDGTPRKLLDVTRLRDAGWSATIGLSEGIRATYGAYVSEAGGT